MDGCIDSKISVARSFQRRYRMMPAQETPTEVREVTVKVVDGPSEMDLMLSFFGKRPKLTSMETPRKKIIEEAEDLIIEQCCDLSFLLEKGLWKILSPVSEEIKTLIQRRREADRIPAGLVDYYSCYVFSGRIKIRPMRITQIKENGERTIDGFWCESHTYTYGWEHVRITFSTKTRKGELTLSKDRTY